MNSNLVKTALGSASLIILWMLFLSPLEPTWTLLFGLAIALVDAFYLNRGENRSSQFPRLLILCILLASAWEWGYDWAKGDLTSDVFRGVYEKGLGPLYGKEQVFSSAYQFLWLGVCILPVILPKNLKNPWVFAGVTLLLILGTSAQDGWIRLTEWKSHMETFTEGLSVFPNGVEWNQYISNMGQMGVHNDHYPPLPLTLLSELSPLTTSIFLMLCVLGAALLARKWLGAEIALALPLLFVFTPYTWVPLYLLLGFVALGLSRKIESKNSWMGLIFLWTFLAFFTYGAWMGMAVFFAILALRQSPTSLIVPALVVGIGTIVLVVLISILSGFNYWEGLQEAIRQNSELLKNPEYWSPFTAGLWRSTGNLLAFGLILGPLTWTRIQSYSAKNQWGLLVIFGLMAFSGLFYMETERVWALYAPFLFLLPADNTKTTEQTSENMEVPLYLWILHWTYLAIMIYRVDLSFGAFG